ncbi:MAG TPA: glycosyltransferase [Lamprocystis sp. (in: g-proteobacteria)]|nr:glycosyltransferase [Lamprocystis sp. (in: g-proteobacteria)]
MPARMPARLPRLLVFSSLFPHAAAPATGSFVRERMFRVGQQLPLAVVSPRPASPADALVRRFRPRYRTPAPRGEQQQGFAVQFPRFPSIPGLFRGGDGLMMALGCLPLLYRQRHTFDLIDAHFAYPDGYAATRLGHWLGKPVTVTLRGTEVPHSRDPTKRRRLIETFRDADHLFTVAGSLARLAINLGADPAKVQVVGNGVDLARFRPLDRAAARARFGLPATAEVLISVGGLVERKGFHRVIEVMPELLRKHPRLVYMIVGGAGPEGDYAQSLRDQIAALGLNDRVRFLGQVAPDRLAEPLSAADCFVLATSNEGWANVFLEAMACGLPVVTTDVGGNPEVVSDDTLGTIVPFGDARDLADAISAALNRNWDRAAIRAYAERNPWEQRVATLVQAFERIAADHRGSHKERY